MSTADREQLPSVLWWFRQGNPGTENAFPPDPGCSDGTRGANAPPSVWHTSDPARAPSTLTLSVRLLSQGLGRKTLRGAEASNRQRWLGSRNLASGPGPQGATPYQHPAWEMTGLHPWLQCFTAPCSHGVEHRLHLLDSGLACGTCCGNGRLAGAAMEGE